MILNTQSLNQDDTLLSYEKNSLFVDNREMIKFLDDERNNESLLKSFIKFYDKYGSQTNIIYLHQNGYFQIPDFFTETILEKAAQHGQLEVVRYFHQNGVNLNSDMATNALRQALARDKVEILKYFHQQGFSFENEFVDELVVSCGAYGSINCLEYLLHNGLFMIQEGQNSYVAENSLSKAIIADRVEVIKYFHQQGFIFNMDIVEKLANLCGIYGSLECLKYLFHSGFLVMQEDRIWRSIMVASDGDQSNVIDFYYKNGTSIHFEFCKKILSAAIVADKVEIIQYFHQQGFSFESELVEQFTASCGVYGSLNCFKYLCETGLLLSTKRIEEIEKEIFNSFGDGNFNLMENHRQMEKKYCNNEKKFLANPADLISLKKSLCVLHNNKINNLEDLFVSLTEKEIEWCYYAAVSNNHIIVFYYMREAFPFLVFDEEIEEEAFDLALCNNRAEIVSFYLSNNRRFIKNKVILKKIANSVALFCEHQIVDMFIEHCNKLNLKIKSRLLYYAAVNNKIDLIIYLNQIQGASLEIFLKIHTESLREGPVRKLLSDRKYLNEMKEDLPLLNEMNANIKNDDKIFHPSLFWEFFNEVNLTRLKESGFRNFKRSVNQNYFNFIPAFFMDYFVVSIAFLKFFGFIKSKSKFQLTDPDIINSDGDLKEEYRRVFQKNRHLKLFLYKVIVGNLWDYVKGCDSEGLLQRLEEPKIGNPIELRSDKKLVSQDLANSVQEYYFIKPYIKQIARDPLTIVEIGAGYGRLGYVLLNAMNCKYIIFDISPALYIAQKYLSILFPNKKIFSFRDINSFDEIKEELEQSDIAFFTINQIKFFPENFADFSINISSLHEMTIKQREKISEYMSKITRKFIYIKQYKKYKNPFDKIVVKEKSYMFSPPWRRVQRRTTPTNIRFFEMIFHKNLP